MPHVTVDDGTELYYEDRGAGDCLLFVHGVLMGGGVWERQTAVLADDYRVVTVDLRGHGRSEAPVRGYTLERYAEDLAELVDRLGLSVTTYVGWSFGAIVGTKLLAEHDVDVASTVLASAGMFHRVANPDDQSLEFVDFEAFLREYATRRPEALAGFLDALFRADAGEHTRRWVHGIGMESALHAGLRTLEATGEVDFREFVTYLEDLSLPALVIHGREDVVATMDDAATVARELLADGHLVPFEESGHFPFLAEPAKFNAHLSAFADAQG